MCYFGGAEASLLQVLCHFAAFKVWNLPARQKIWKQRSKLACSSSCFWCWPRRSEARLLDTTSCFAPWPQIRASFEYTPALFLNPCTHNHEFHVWEGGKVLFEWVCLESDSWPQSLINCNRQGTITAVRTSSDRSADSRSNFSVCVWIFNVLSEIQGLKKRISVYVQKDFYQSTNIQTYYRTNTCFCRSV